MMIGLRMESMQVMKYWPLTSKQITENSSNMATLLMDLKLEAY